ncbi:MAG: alkaline phosphatase family protein [Thermoanaerobaculia bacterium]
MIARRAPSRFKGPLAGALSLSALLLAAACGRGDETGSASPASAEPASARSVFFVGLDGADWQFLEPLMAAGRMPNLARLERQGSGGVLITEQPPLSPLLWTTMMTGRSPLEHRILDFVRFHPATGRREPITSDERRVPAVWNIASDAGREVAVLGLWATFPADETKGLLVSNLFVSARGSFGHALSPEKEAPWAEKLRGEAADSVDLAAMRGVIPDLSADELAAAAASSDPFAEKIPGLRQVLVQTEIVRRLADAWLTRHPTRLAVVYFEGTDTIGHLFAPFVAPALAGVDSGDVARFAGVPARYYELIDGVIGELADLAARSGAVLMIASDHGFQWREGRPAGLSSVARATAAKWHRDEGIYLLVGPGIPALPGHLGRGGVAQVAASLLSLVDMPPLGGMAPALAEAGPQPGTTADAKRSPQPRRAPVLAESGSAEKPDWEPAPTRQVPVPGNVSSSQSAAPATSEEELRKLQALGYLGSREAGNAGPRPHGTRTAGSFSNEAQILEALGRTAEARRCYEQALEQEPGDVAAKWNLSNLLFEADREAVRSDRLLVEAILGGLTAGDELVVARAAAWRERGRLDRALSLLDAAVAGVPASVPLRLFRGRTRIEQGDCRGAAADFAEAVRRDEGRAGSWAAFATAQLCLGDRRAARRSFTRAVELAPEREELRRALASLEEPLPRR